MTVATFPASISAIMRLKFGRSKVTLETPSSMNLFQPIICYFLFLFPFHSFPVLSLICNVISFVVSIGKEHSFPKMLCILLVGALVASGDRLTPTEPVGETFPKPSDFPLTTYNTGQSDFAEVLRKFFQKVFLISYYGKVSKMPKLSLIHMRNLRLDEQHSKAYNSS